MIAPRPAIGAPAPFAMPEARVAEVADGLRVLAIDLPGRALGSARLLVDAGALWEDPDRGGLASLVADALLEGTHERSAEQMSDELERLGARVSAGAGWDSLGVGVGAPVDRLQDALGLVAEAVMSPAFPDEAVQRLRAERVGHLAQMLAQPAGRARVAFAEAVFDAQGPYARDPHGSAESVSRIVRDDLASHHERFVTPTSATLIVAGDLGGTDPAAFAEPFAGWRSRRTERPVPEPRATDGGVSVTVVHRPGSVQSAVQVGHIGVARNDPDHDAFEVVFDALGGLFNSRMNLVLREEKGFTYGMRSSFDAARLSGSIAFGAPVESRHTAESIGLIIEQVAQMRDGGPTQQELDDVRDHLAGVFALRNQTAGQIAMLVATQVTHGLPATYWNDLPLQRSAFTVEGLAQIAARVLRPDELRVAVVGDADVIGRDLEALDVGPVTVVSD